MIKSLEVTYPVVICPVCGKLVLSNLDGTPVPHTNRLGATCKSKRDKGENK